MMMKIRLLSLVVLLSVMANMGCAEKKATAAPAGEAQQFTVQPSGKTAHLVAYGDVRFMNPKDTEASNPTARRAIVDAIAKAKPDAILFTGDLVAKGGRENDWNVFVEETKPFRDAGVKFFTLPGNHELYGDAQLANYFQHFPALKNERWYSVRDGNTLSLMLDSDVDGANSPEWKWVDQQLSSVPNDVDFVFIALHHPPYTRSSEKLPGGGHSARAQEQALAKMIEQHAANMRQKIVVLAGHVHSYERYEYGGVTYLVTGGGGATPYRIARQPGDPFQGQGPMYHYMSFDVDGTKLKAEMHKWDPQTGKFSVADKFELQATKAEKKGA